MAQCPEARRLWFSFAEPNPGREATKSLCVCAERRGQPVHLLLWPSVYPGIDWGGPRKLVAVGPPGVSPGSALLMLSPRRQWLCCSSGPEGLLVSRVCCGLGVFSTEMIWETILRDLFAFKVEL